MCANLLIKGTVDVLLVGNDCGVGPLAQRPLVEYGALGRHLVINQKLEGGANDDGHFANE